MSRYPTRNKSISKNKLIISTEELLIEGESIGNISSTLADLTDTDISSPTTNEVLTWTANNKWENKEAPVLNLETVNPVSIGIDTASSGFDTRVRIGPKSGLNNQQPGGVALGSRAGYNCQRTDGIAIGPNAGYECQGVESILIGKSAGNLNAGQGTIGIGSFAAFDTGSATNQIAIGKEAARNDGGTNSIAIGNSASKSRCCNNTICINATGSDLPAGTVSATFIKPIRDATATSKSLYYNTSTGEITSGVVPSGTSPNLLSLNPVFIGTAQNSFEDPQNIAIGVGAGYTCQCNYSICIGAYAGLDCSKQDSIAIGREAGGFGTGCNSISLGHRAAYTWMADDFIAIGNEAGSRGFGPNSVAIGKNAGSNRIRTEGVAIGAEAGRWCQKDRAVSIGYEAGSNALGSNSVAIGSLSAKSVGSNNTICINATGLDLPAGSDSSTFIKPVRDISDLTGFVQIYYNKTTGEMVSYTPP